MTKYIHVNRQFIAMNAKDGGNRPVYTVKFSKSGKPRYARSVDILGPSTMVADEGQLKCGARVWIETDAEVVLHDECSFQEAKNS